MQVFKAYLKIIGKNKGQLLMYLGIVVALAIMMTMFNSQGNQTGFAATKVNIAFFNDDTSNGISIVNGLQDYLAQIAIIEDVADDPEAIRDALFFGKIYYAVRVPQGFAASFDQDGSAQLETIAAPDSTTSIYLELLVNKYLNTARIYRKGLPDASMSEIIRLTSENLAISTPVELKSLQTRQESKGSQGSFDNLVYYFNYLAYSLLSILILGVSTCMMTFNNIDLKRRNLCSPLTQRSMNLQLIAGNLVFSLFSWAILILVSFLLYFRAMFSSIGLLFGLNSLVFMIVALSLSFMIGNLLKSRNAQAAVSNVLTLGTCFIAGVFVPQAILGKTVLAIARVTPTYWYVRANNEIGSLATISTQSLSLIWPSLAIQLLFAAVFLALSWIIIRKRRQQA
jgi:ABC-2 type transport system permease protein